MLCEFVFPYNTQANGFSHYVQSLAPTSGLQLIEHNSSATIVEGEWEAVMTFLRRCHDYIQDHGFNINAITTMHIHD